MSPPANLKKSSVDNTRNATKPADKSDLFKTQELIVSEQQNVLHLLNVTVKFAPGMLGNDAIKKGKSGTFRPFLSNNCINESVRRFKGEH